MDYIQFSPFQGSSTVTPFFGTKRTNVWVAVRTNSHGLQKSVHSMRLLKSLTSKYRYCTFHLQRTEKKLMARNKWQETGARKLVALCRCGLLTLEGN
uniref:Uncharacterized protein n=1 Tax=Arion vulgaris TaxID=1028688 RepID=A0A0B6ZX06_9EUPU